MLMQCYGSRRPRGREVIRSLRSLQTESDGEVTSSTGLAVKMLNRQVTQVNRMSSGWDSPLPFRDTEACAYEVLRTMSACWMQRRRDDVGRWPLSEREEGVYAKMLSGETGPT